MSDRTGGAPSVAGRKPEGSRSGADAKARAASLAPVRWGGSAAILAGILFAAWGYLHGTATPPWSAPVAQVLGFVVPLLFLVAFIGLYARHEGRSTWLGGMGFVLGFFGSGWGIVHGTVDMSLWYAYVGGKAWASLLNWLPLLLAGLTLVGIAAVGVKASRGLGVSLLVTGAVGWAYYFTDSGGIAETRLGHVAFGVLFSLGWMSTGFAVWSRGGTANRKEPRP